MKLVVISHTAHGYKSDGSVVGWGPTVREIDLLSVHFDQVWHLAYMIKEAPPTFTPYRNGKVIFIPLKVAGGKRFHDKLHVISLMVSNLKIIRNVLKQADAVQVRLPTGIGVYLLPWISWFLKRTFVLWVKYAGNWAHSNPPITYKFQRWFLKRNFQRSYVTINGVWDNQPKHCLTFENPCLTEDEVRQGELATRGKDFGERITLLFVGRIEPAKGVDRILEMLGLMKMTNRIQEIIFVGSGNIEAYQGKSAHLEFKVTFTGGIERNLLNEYYAKSHMLLLPSDSEGFPKVVAEAAAFGCVPCVSNVSSLGQYISSDNGHLFSSLNPEIMAKELDMLLSEPMELEKRALNALNLANRFTYAYYNERILNEIVLGPDEAGIYRK
jgi:glycosyltransferase involved in cell wall biosynthesis